MGTAILVDVVVVGGGPAGLSAALILGRCRRRVVLCDSGHYRNAASHALHGFLTRDGTDPAELRALGRRELSRYHTVEVRDEAVEDARRRPDGGFEVDLADGTTLACRKLLLATGVVDALPAIDGFAAIYGRSAFHCPYCDGWEWRDRRLAVHGEGSKARALALELLGWSADVALLTGGGGGLGPEERRELARAGVALDERGVASLESDEGLLRRIHFRSGDPLERDALFFASADTQRSPLAERLGCDFTERGAVATGAYERTGVPGLFVAGDASRQVELAIVAAAEGALAAFAINCELLREDRHAD